MALTVRPNPEEMTEAEREARIDSLSRQGQADFAAGRLRDALRHFREVLALEPERAQTWVQVGAVHVQRDEKSKAVEALEQAAEVGMLDFEFLQSLEEFEPLRGYAPYEAFLERRDHFAEVFAARRLDALRERLGEAYTYRLDPEMRLIVATDRSDWVVDAITENLALTAEALWQELFAHRPEDFLSVLVPSRADFERFLQFSVSSDIGGVYMPQRRLLVARRPDYMLRHEYIHFLHFADLEHYANRQNIWFLEGLATLFENSAYSTEERAVVPVPNSRQNLLLRLEARDQLASWREMMAMEPDRFMKSAAEHYAHARYICWWLWEQELLRPFHEAYAENVEQDPSGVQALEQVLGMSVEQAEKEWREWVRRELSFFHGVSEPRRAYLGISLEEDRDEGVRIIAVGDDTPAAKAGLAPGERILRIGARRVLTSEDIVDELLAHRPGGVLPLTVERSDAVVDADATETVEARTVEVTLDQAPEPEQVPEPDFEQPRADPR